MLRRFFEKIEHARRAKTAAKLRHRFFDLLAKSDVDVFVEVGAYDGTAALEARRLLKSARIVSFEANPNNYNHFSQQLRHGDHGVEFIHSAVSDRVGTLVFKIAYANPEGLSKKSSLLSRIAPTTAQDISAPCTTLDHFFAEAQGLRFALWIDVEGASREVLAGATQVLATTDLVLIEVEERRFWENQWLKSDVLACLEGFGLNAIDRDDEFPDQHNVLLRRSK